MTRAPFPPSQHFLFEIEVGVSSALALSSGELAMLISDGLSALDDRGLLFPGVTTPDRGNRLLGVKIGAIGYQRFGRTGPADEAYRRLFMGRGRRRSHRSLGERLDSRIVELSAGLINQRMLIARLTGLSDKCRHPTALSDADRTIGEALLTASDTIIQTVEDQLKPVL